MANRVDIKYVMYRLHGIIQDTKHDHYELQEELVDFIGELAYNLRVDELDVNPYKDTEE